MSRATLVDAIIKSLANHPKAHITQTNAVAIVDAVTAHITESLRTQGSFALKGFGSFRTAPRAARNGRNPSTGESLQIPATQTVTFKPAADLKAQAAEFALPEKRAVAVKSSTRVAKKTTKKAKH